MEKHTDGPWIASKDNTGTSLVHAPEMLSTWDLRPELICACGGNEANARLIAAAPDMVTLLDQINTCLNDDLKIEQGDPIHKLIKNTIFKAVGA